MNDKTINRVLEEALQKNMPQAAAEAANRLLSEDIKVGQEVVSVDPETIVGGYVGKGRVKKISNEPSGCAEVEFPSGAVVQAQMSLLVPV